METFSRTLLALDTSLPTNHVQSVQEDNTVTRRVELLLTQSLVQVDSVALMVRHKRTNSVPRGALQDTTVRLAPLAPELNAVVPPCSALKDRILRLTCQWAILVLETRLPHSEQPFHVLLDSSALVGCALLVMLVHFLHQKSLWRTGLRANLAYRDSIVLQETQALELQALLHPPSSCAPQPTIQSQRRTIASMEQGIRFQETGL